ncbi:MAG: response regulator transcription factor [Syntrophomonadaceae bacterium]|nr:response regulator transcription factor [Syntrophomonadaceae bacterium]
MGKNVLIVEDDIRMRNLLIRYFNKEGYNTFEAGTGKEALSKFHENKINIVILDLMIPAPNGFEVCKIIRQDSSVPIIILTARAEDDDKVMGFELGADDYITKPFTPRILMARTKALIKRFNNMGANNENFIKYKGIEVNTGSHKIKVNANEVNLSPIEYELLIYLIKNKNQVLSREQILNAVWGFNYNGDLRTVDTHIWRLREKLQGKGELINTVRGYGYMLDGRKWERI